MYCHSLACKGRPPGRGRVDQCRTLACAILDNVALEHLHRAANEGHHPRRRVAERRYTAILLEEAPDIAIVDAIPRLAKVAIVMDDGGCVQTRGRRRHGSKRWYWSRRGAVGNWSGSSSKDRVGRRYRHVAGLTG